MPQRHHHHGHHHHHHSSSSSVTSGISSTPGAIPFLAQDDKKYAEVPPPTNIHGKRPVLPGMDQQTPSSEGGPNPGSAVGGQQVGATAKKVPFAKPIPKNFVNSWNHDLSVPPQTQMQQMPPGMPPPGMMQGPPPPVQGQGDPGGGGGGYPSQPPPAPMHQGGPPMGPDAMDDPNCISLQVHTRFSSNFLEF